MSTSEHNFYFHMPNGLFREQFREGPFNFEEAKQKGIERAKETHAKIVIISKKIPLEWETIFNLESILHELEDDAKIYCSDFDKELFDNFSIKDGEELTKIITDFFKSKNINIEKFSHFKYIEEIEVKK